MCLALHLNCSKKFCIHNKYEPIGEIVMLRGFCAAITSPQAYDLAKGSSTIANLNTDIFHYTAQEISQEERDKLYCIAKALVSNLILMKTVFLLYKDVLNKGGRSY
jgi:hypothetical protein